MAGESASHDEAHSVNHTVAVEPDGTRGRSIQSTQGDLRGENSAEVCRGHSSEDAGRKGRNSEGPKNEGTQLTENLTQGPQTGSETRGRHNYGDHPRSAQRGDETE